jgi:hypothetical protein
VNAASSLDRKIDHYKWLATYVNDERTAKGISDLIRQHHAEKAELHPEEK